MGRKKYINCTFMCFTLVTLVLVFAVGCEKKDNVVVAKAVPVKILNVKKEKFENTTTFVGMLTSENVTNISSRVSGPIEKILVKDGDNVKKGQALMTIESSEQQASINLAKSNVNSASQEISQIKVSLEGYKSDISSAESSLNLAKTDLDRYKNLFKDGSATKSDLDSKQNTYNQAVSQLSSAKSNYEAQKQFLNVKRSNYNASNAQLKQQEIIAGHYVVKAPFSGSIGVINAKNGQYVDSSVILTTLSVDNPIQVQFGVDERFKDKLKKGLSVKISDTSNVHFAESKLFFISPKVDKQVQSIIVKATFNNLSKYFYPDQTVNAKVIWDVEDVISVPTYAVVNYVGQDFVYVVKNINNVLTAVQTPIKLREINGDKFIILSGLNVGDQVIVSNIQKLRNGSSVKI